jgi:hypothetical protein|tara:strand:+ start:2645 stop:2752 length:108 start_codon:yes stop_codon:yes gene_type:complete
VVEIRGGEKTELLKELLRRGILLRIFLPLLFELPL